MIVVMVVVVVGIRAVLVVVVVAVRRLPLLNPGRWVCPQGGLQQQRVQRVETVVVVGIQAVPVLVVEALRQFPLLKPERRIYLHVGPQQQRVQRVKWTPWSLLQRRGVWGSHFGVSVKLTGPYRLDKVQKKKKKRS